MNILITGGKGFLGSNLAMNFSARGYQVTGIGRGFLSGIEQKQLGYQRWVCSNLTSEVLGNLKIVPDVIIHCAGSGSVSKSLTDQVRDYEDTVEGTRIVLEYTKNFPKAKLIYPSSPAVNGSCLNQPISINSQLMPVSPYGVHKLRAENLCDLYKIKYKLNIYIVRLFSIYGVGLKKQLLWDACEKFNKKKPEFWGTGKETRDFIHINDVSNLFNLLAVNKDSGLPYKMNCGGGRAVTINNILESVKKYFDESIKLQFNGVIREGDPQYYWSDNSESYKYGWKPEVEFQTGIEEYIEWYKNTS